MLLRPVSGGISAGELESECSVVTASN